MNEGLIVRFLLGELGEAEQVEIEDRAFGDARLLKAIQAVEADLIDEYVRGELSGSRRLRFEERFLSSLERRRKIEFARALTTVAAEAPARLARPAAALPGAGWRTAFAAFVRSLGPVGSFAAAAAVLLALIGGSLLVVETLKLRGQLRAAQQARLEQERDLQRQLDEERARGEEVASRLQLEQQQGERRDQLISDLERDRVAIAPEARPAIISLSLIAGIPRSGSAKPKLTLPQAARLARLQMEIEPADDYSSFGAELRNQAGQTVWTRSNLSARATRSGRAVVLNLPASILRAEHYELTLKGITDGGAIEEVGYYYFDVVKK